MSLKTCWLCDQCALGAQILGVTPRNIPTRKLSITRASGFFAWLLGGMALLGSRFCHCLSICFIEIPHMNRDYHSERSCDIQCMCFKTCWFLNRALFGPAGNSRGTPLHSGNMSCPQPSFAAASELCRRVRRKAATWEVFKLHQDGTHSIRLIMNGLIYNIHIICDLFTYIFYSIF